MLIMSNIINAVFQFIHLRTYCHYLSLLTSVPHSHHVKHVKWLLIVKVSDWLKSVGFFFFLLFTTFYWIRADLQ